MARARIWFTVILFCSALRAWAEKAPLDISGDITFETGTPKQLQEAKEILKEVQGHFKSVFKKEIDTPCIDIEFASQLSTQAGSPCTSFEGRVEGISRPTESGGYCIKISNERTSTWGRILAHEMAHVVLQQAFGVHRNLWLSEGMAEFLAGESFPSEVRNAHRRQERKHFVSTELVPYVEGYTFCNRHFKDVCFIGFYEAEAKNEVQSMSELESRWERFKIKQNEANPPK